LKGQSSLIVARRGGCQYENQPIPSAIRPWRTASRAHQDSLIRISSLEWWKSAIRVESRGSRSFLRPGGHRMRVSVAKPARRGLALLLFGGALSALAQDRPAYRDPSRPVEERVRDLLSRMTLEEKVAQTLAMWKGKEAITDEKGQFDAAKAKGVIANGIGQIA